MSASDVMKQIKDNDVKFVDLRFTDPRGKLQHVTMDCAVADEDMFAGGLHKVEIRRDHNFYPPHESLPGLSGRLRTLRSRPLSYDEEWVSMTDCSGIDQEIEHPDYLKWLLKQ